MLDQNRDARAASRSSPGSTDAWHQVGNDHVVANAYNHGYVQLWSQDRRYQWVNRQDDASGHFGGGYGYLRVGGARSATLYDDRPAARGRCATYRRGETHPRDWARPGVRGRGGLRALRDDPLLLHDADDHQHHQSHPPDEPGSSTGDVQPLRPATKPSHGAFRSAPHDAASRRLTVAQAQQQVARPSPTRPRGSTSAR